MYSKNKILKNLFFVLVLLIIALIFVFSLGDIKEIFNVLINQTNYAYILVCVGLLFLYFIIMQLSFLILIRYRSKEISLAFSFYISGTNFFFDNITPFSSGGQPFQAYSLKQRNMKLSDSTSILLANFISYQICINVIFAIFLGCFYNKLATQIDNFMWLVFISYSINLVIMLFLLLIGCTKFVGNSLVAIMRALSKIKCLKKLLEPRIPKFLTYIEETQKDFKEIKNNMGVIVINFLLKLIALFIYYSIPFFICLAIGIPLDIKEMFYIMAITCTALTITIWVPTPGAVGGVELAFTLLFSTFLVGYDNIEGITLSAMLLWRLITYYLVIAYGFIMYMLFERLNRLNPVIKNSE